MTEGVKLSELAAGIAVRGAVLATESGLFVLLQACDVVRDAPRKVTTDSVRVTADGAVVLDGAPSGTEREAVASLALVAEAILFQAPAGAQALFARVRANEVRSITEFRAETEALLVPLNRAAARRVLGRLVRDHVRVSDRSAGSAATSEGEDSIPRFPPPPRLGSIASLPIGGSATDTEPDVIVRKPSAVDTTPDAPTRGPSDAGPPAATDTIPDSPVAAPRRAGLRWWLAAAAVIGGALIAYGVYTVLGAPPAPAARSSHAQ